MIDSLTIALSGLKANEDRAAVAAENIANISTAGSIPGSAVDHPKDVYIPSRATQTAISTYNPGYNSSGTVRGAGVRSDVVKKDPGYVIAPDQSAPYADENGLVAVPDVDLASEIVNLKLASTLFRANVSVIRTVQEMNDALLDIKA